MFLVTFSIVSAVFSFAESPGYFLEYVREDLFFYKEASDYRKAYPHLLGKKISEDEWFKYFSENRGDYMKADSDLFDLKAKCKFLHDMSCEGDGENKIEYCEMMREMLRDIYSDYEGICSYREFSEVVKAEVQNYINSRSDEDQERYRRLMFYRDRAYYVWLNISVSHIGIRFVERLFRVYGKDYRKIIENYERSLIWKERDLPLSEFMRLFFPKDRKSIEAIEREERKMNEEHEIIEKMRGRRKTLCLA